MIDTTSIEQGLVQMADRASRQMTSRLRRSAYESGWPVSVARHLRVDNDASHDFSVSYPEHVSAAVEDLEYGTQSAPPNPVIRQFRNRHGVRTAL